MCSAPSCSWTYRNFGERGPRPRRAIKTRPKRQRGANLMVPASDCFSSHEECERQSASCLDDRPGIAAFRSSLSPAAGSRRRPGQRPGARIVRSLTEGCAPHGPRAAMCAGRASPVSGSHYRRARGREDSANTQPALLRGREMPSPQLRWRAAARRWATSWLAPGGQASQRQPPQRRPSSEERGETSTRFRSTKVLKRPRTWICGGQARGTPARLGRRVTTRRLCVIILHAFRMSIDKTSSAKGKGGPKAALSVGVNDPSAALQAWSETEVIGSGWALFEPLGRQG